MTDTSGYAEAGDTIEVPVAEWLALRADNAALRAEVERLRSQIQNVADHLRTEADKDKYGPFWRPLHYSAEHIERVLIPALTERKP